MVTDFKSLAGYRRLPFGAVIPVAAMVIGASAACGDARTAGPDALPLTYNGTVSSQLVVRSVGTSSVGTATCTYTHNVTAIIVVIIDEPAAESISATTNINLIAPLVEVTRTPPSPSNQTGLCGAGPGVPGGWNPSLRGPRGNLTGSVTNSAPGGPAFTLSFTGALNGTRLTGTLRLTIERQSTMTNAGGITTVENTSGSVEFPISLEPQG